MVASRATRAAATRRRISMSSTTPPAASIAGNTRYSSTLSRQYPTPYNGGDTEGQPLIPLELLAQPADVHVDGLAVAEEVASPQLPDEVLARLRNRRPVSAIAPPSCSRGLS